MPNDGASEAELIDEAVTGNEHALTALLWTYYGRLSGRLKRKLPADLRSILAAEDLIQEVHVAAFRTIGSFKPQGENAFYRWLATMADRRLVDRIKEQRRAKRGGAARRVGTPRDAAASSVASLLQLVAVDDHTPSRSVARHERERAIQVALAGLKDDYREALTLRYAHGLSVAKIAAKMKRSERSVQMLCNRGLKKMRTALGHASQYLTRG